MTEKTRLSDYTRVSISNSRNPVTIEQRTVAGRGGRFGDGGSVGLSDEEAEELYELLAERFSETSSEEEGEK